MLALSLNASFDRITETLKFSYSHICEGITHKIAATYLGRPHLVRGRKLFSAF